MRTFTHGHKSNTARAAAMYSMYTDGKSIAQVAIQFGVSRQSVWAMLKSHGLPTRPKRYQKAVEYGGFKYTLDRYGYYRRTTGPKGRERLHIRIYREHYGDIPKGCEIHHKNGDKTDNDPSNLVCLTKPEHTSLHARERASV